MLKIEGKTFMNIQEAVQWLLDNNALPFQCSANYIAGTEIGLGTIVNPTPAKVRIGSIIFFADSKVSTVVGITETGFICSDKYNNLVDDIAYVTNVAINGSGHLITTLSDGQTIDAGIVKQVSAFSINASQHLIVTYNDGSTTDLGAIFSGNVTISGSLTVVGGLSADIPFETIKDSNGHNRFFEGDINLTASAPAGMTKAYGKYALSGTHLLMVLCLNLANGITVGDNVNFASFTLPLWVLDKIVPVISNIIEYRTFEAYATNYTKQDFKIRLTKGTAGLSIIKEAGTTLDNDRTVRIALDLLIDNA